jgi:hypothetical protein
MTLRTDLVAPCGINCGVCMRYLATTTGIAQKTRRPQCTGCRLKNKNCAFIKGSCEWLRKKKVTFCFECPTFPCAKLERLDKRYTVRYDTSLIGNLLQIKQEGLERFLEKEAEKWKCPMCGGTVSIHDKKCYNCEMLPTKTKK